MPYINIEQIYFDITNTNKDKHLVELELKYCFVVEYTLQLPPVCSG